ncbi:MAG: hypothetical protein LBI20_03010 [Holosporales bacterium]|nr:hypothetical protein [Holosporales bacterium]
MNNKTYSRVVVKINPWVESKRRSYQTILLRGVKRSRSVRISRHDPSSPPSIQGKRVIYTKYLALNTKTYHRVVVKINQ